MIICISLMIIQFFYKLTAHEPTVYIASDNDQYKLCGSSPTVYTKTETFNIIMMITLTFCWFMIDFYLLYCLYWKTKKFEHYQAQNIINLSPYFSSRNNNLINTKIIKGNIFCGSLLKISGILIVASNKKFLFPTLGILTCLTVIASFDFKSCDNNNNNHALPVSINTNNDDNDNNLMTKQEKDEYINKLMTEYYKKPKRNKLKSNLLSQIN